jgi:predicted kinase
MSTVTLTVGIPASGKTTWARQTALGDPNTVIVCRDDIRASMGMRTGVDENKVTRIHKAQIEAALLEGMDVIVADTNINKTFRNRLIKFAHQLGADVELSPFPISLDEAIIRDSRRGDLSVGADVVRKFHDMLQGQQIDMQHVTKIPVPSFPAVPRYNHDSLSDVIVVDIDGTVADHNGHRSPYDYSKVGKDSPIQDVIDIVTQVGKKYPVIFVSGRDDVCYVDTVAWITEHFGSDFMENDFQGLLMRETGDQRPDYIIKNEIYDKKILPISNIVMVFDDRDQVVYHLRKRGITVAQVAPGRF